MHDFYEKLVTNTNALLNNFSYFPRLAELSPISFVRFIGKLVDTSNSQLNDLICKKGTSTVFDGLMYIMTALDVCTANDEVANEAFDVYQMSFDPCYFAPAERQN